MIGFLAFLEIQYSKMGTSLQLEIEKTQFVAPMSDICQNWQNSGQVELDWYFNLVNQFGGEKVIFNSVELDTDIYSQLNDQAEKYRLRSQYVVTTDQFCEIKNLGEKLEAGILFSVLIYEPLSTELICKIEECQKYLDQFQFVILARKDWNVRNCFRSVPHFMRSRLFVDFPVSLHEKDPFYAASEVPRTKRKFEQDFLQSELQSFCPNLGLLNEWRKKNVSHFSQPRKLLRSQPKVSIIVLNPEHLEDLTKSKALQENPELFEILITRVAGQKTKVIPKIKSVTTTRYWAHPVDENQPVSEILLANFTATQADGDVLLFLDPSTGKNLDTLLSLLVSATPNFAKVLSRKGVFIFNKTEFLSASGFDELLGSWEGQKLDMLAGIYSDKESGEFLKGHWAEKLQRLADKKDQLFLAHRYSSQIDDFSFLEGKKSLSNQVTSEEHDRNYYLKQQARDKYLSLYQATPKVVVEGHLSYITGPMEVFFFRLKHFFRLHSWKWNPARLQHPLKEHGWKWNPARLQHPLKEHGWKWNPARLQHPLKEHGWKWNPVRLQHPLKEHGWKWNPARLQHPLKEHGWKWNPARLQHPLKEHGWKWNPLRLRHPLRRHLWKLSPFRYELVWKAIYAPKKLYWLANGTLQRTFGGIRWMIGGIYGISVRCFWKIFYLSYPIRKIYYFSQFQYEKRILGLHRQKISNQEKSR